MKSLTVRLSVFLAAAAVFSFGPALFQQLVLGTTLIALAGGTVRVAAIAVPYILGGASMVLLWQGMCRGVTGAQDNEGDAQNNGPQGPPPQGMAARNSQN